MSISHLNSIDKSSPSVVRTASEAKVEAGLSLSSSSSSSSSRSSLSLPISLPLTGVKYGDVIKPIETYLERLQRSIDYAIQSYHFIGHSYDEAKPLPSYSTLQESIKRARLTENTASLVSGRGSLVFRGDRAGLAIGVPPSSGVSPASPLSSGDGEKPLAPGSSGSASLAYQ